jgi:hypothetical protein
MRHTILTFCLLFLFGAGYAQRVVNVDAADGINASDKNAMAAVSGQVYTGIKYVRITAGTPFFKEKFMKASLFDDNHGRYHCDAARLNLLDNEINFLGADGKEMTAASPITNIVFIDSITKVQYLFTLGRELGVADHSLDNAWFEVLVNDNVSLCRFVKKRIHETPAYGTATTEEDILSIESYYLHDQRGLTQIKDWAQLQELLQDKKTELTPYIKDHKLKGKAPADYVQLVTAYNASKKS